MTYSHSTILDYKVGFLPTPAKASDKRVRFTDDTGYPSAPESTEKSLTQGLVYVLVDFNLYLSLVGKAIHPTSNSRYFDRDCLFLKLTQVAVNSL